MDRTEGDGPLRSIGLLALDATSRAEVLARLQRIVATHFDGIGDLAVAPIGDAAERAVAVVEAIDLEHGVEPPALLDEVEALLRQGIVHTGHPGYLGLFNPAATFLGVVGDALAATFNPQLAVTSHAPAAVAVERAFTDMLSGRLGLPGGSVGQFTSGGSEANLLGLLLGLHRTFPSVPHDGLWGLDRRPTLYTSVEGHHSTAKLARATGLGVGSVRAIPVDAGHRLDLAALDRTIADDRSAGRAPFLVVATAGTTGSGAIDPLPEVAALAQREALHLHVDAAWAGALALSDRHRPLLEGIDQADSITVDAHKWLSAPMGAGVLLTPHASDLSGAFAVDTGYMPSADATDPYLTGLQWSRRFIGLKVFLALAAAGRSGVETQLDRDVALGHVLSEGLSEDGWRIRNDTPLPVVCFDDPGVEPERSKDHLWKVLGTVNGTGRVWLSMVTLDGAPAIRACISSYRTTESTVDLVRRLLLEARHA